MIFRRFAFLAGLCTSLPLLSHGQAVAMPSDPDTQAPRPAPAAPNVPANEMLEFYGWFLGRQFECYALGLSDSEVQAIARGIALAAKGGKPESDFAVVGPALEQFLSGRAAAVEKRRLDDSRAEEDAFFAELDKKETVKKTASGLRYEIIQESAGAKPAATDEVQVHYHGTFIDGSVFDSSRERGTPASFALNRVIPGWTEGVQLVGVGGKIKLYVPGKLGYGDRGSDGIPPGKTLIFDVELLSAAPQAPQLPQGGNMPTLAP